MANNQLLASDNFASGSLAAGWVVFPNGSGQEPTITGAPHYAESHAVGTNGGVIWTGISWPNDQISEITIQALTPSTLYTISLYTRVNAAGTTGYYVTLKNGFATLFDYGTGLITYAGPVAVTVAAGDVFTLQSAGSVTTLYQNGTLVLFGFDASFNNVSGGGYPGFAILTSATGTITNAQVSAWHGYSCVQQDGVWQKQGIVLAPNATDIASSGQGLFGGSFILDSNPQLIAGTQVYKTWFSGGTPSSQGTYYAESPDLITWTRKVAQVIAGYVGAMIIKVASTYYSYSQLQNQAGSGNIALHTSSDGIVWTLISSNVLAAGAGGTWDNGGFYPLRPITVINGTWYALTTGGSIPAGQFSIGLATSTDGQTWTKYVSNPVLSNAGSSVYPMNTAWAKVGSTYYFWNSVGPSSPQQAAGQAISFLPAETARYSTTDFINWSAPVHSLHHSDQYEDVNAPVGATPTNPGSSLGPCGIFTVGTQTYVVGQAEVLDGAGGGTQFALAIAPVVLNSLVLSNEDAVQQTNTDAFTSGVGSLSANWSNMTGFTALSIVAGNLCEPSTHAGVNYGAVYTGVSFSTSQYSEVTIKTLSTSGAYAGPMVMASVSGNGYAVEIVGPTGAQGYHAQLIRFTAGTPAILGPLVGITPQVNDVLRMSVVQSVVGPVVSFFQNGFMIFQYVDESSGALITGAPGIYQSEAALGTSQISSWAGGNTGVYPYAPTFSPVAGTYSSTQSVSISTVVTGASIFYTTDGSTPTSGSTLYTTPITVAVTTTIKAIAIVSGTNSVVATATDTISAAVPPVVATAAYSLPDSRVSPAHSRTVQGTKIYDVVPVDSRVAGTVDSRTAGVPVDSRVSSIIPQNSRTPGTFGPGE